MIPFCSDNNLFSILLDPITKLKITEQTIVLDRYLKTSVFYFLSKFVFSLYWFKKTRKLYCSIAKIQTNNKNVEIGFLMISEMLSFYIKYDNVSVHFINGIDLTYLSKLISEIFKLSFKL